MKMTQMKISKPRIITALFAFFLALAVAPAAKADGVTITGSGTYDADAPTTAYSAPGATWYFSFNLPDPINNNPSTQDTSVTFDLNGTQVANSLPGGVLFYSAAQLGGFDLFVPTDLASGTAIISLYFPADVGSNLSLVFGDNAAQIGLNDGDPIGSGNVSITPEPPSILLLGTAFLIASGFLYWRRNDAHAIQPE